MFVWNLQSLSGLQVSSSTSSASLMLTSMFEFLAFCSLVSPLPTWTWLESWWTAFHMACPIPFHHRQSPSVHTARFFFLLPILPINISLPSCAALSMATSVGGTLLLPWLINLSLGDCYDYCVLGSCSHAFGMGLFFLGLGLLQLEEGLI